MPTANDVKQALLSTDSDPYLKSHLARFIESYFFIEKHLARGMRVLDLGSYGHFAQLLRRIHPDIRVEVSADFDLRERFPLDAEQYDIVCCMEVLEHIKDRNSESFDDLARHTGSGAYSMLCEINRILKPGGLLFLTTPNINTYTAILHLLNYESPNFFQPHPKEYSINEVKRMLGKTGFNVLQFTTKDVFGTTAGYNIEPIKRMCSDQSLRGEDMFIIAAKQRAPAALLERNEYFEITFQSLFP